MTRPVVTERLDAGARSTLHGRQRRYAPGPPAAVDALPVTWRALLAAWLRRAPRARWTTLLAEAGNEHVELAHALLEWLLAAGWIALEERRERARWVPIRVEFRDSSALRLALGLPDPASVRAAWTRQRSNLVEIGIDARALSALDRLPDARALERASLMLALERWRADGRVGTRRDFAQFARGATKGVSNAEWDWLGALFDLPAVGIERHTPLLYLRAPLVLVGSEGEVDLGASPDFIGLTNATVNAITAVRGMPRYWRVIENRTSFERAARTYGLADAVVWVPGFAPPWWTEAMARLLAFSPAPAMIACDPDPAGVEIALAVGRLWNQVATVWHPWRMGVADLCGLPVRRPLSQFDRERLAALSKTELPPELTELAQWMAEHGEKGEQEWLI